MAEWERDDPVATKMTGRLPGKWQTPRHRYVPIERAENEPAIGMDPIDTVDRIQAMQPVRKILRAIAQSFRLNANVSGFATILLTPASSAASFLGRRGPRTSATVATCRDSSSRRMKPHTS